MPSISSPHTYNIQCSGAEFRLITMALSGVLKPMDKEKALALAQAMLVQRAKEAQIHLEISVGAHQNFVKRFGPEHTGVTEEDELAIEDENNIGNR